MSIALPGTTSGNIISEYAATTTNINRFMIVGEDGFLIPVFSCSIHYEKKDYVIDSSGNKLGVFNKQPTSPSLIPSLGLITEDQSRGNINLDYTTFAQYFSKQTKEGDILGLVVSDLIDELIRLDLIKRNILTA